MGKTAAKQPGVRPGIREALPARHALEAIVARLEGEYDNPALKAHGVLFVDSKEDVLLIARGALAFPDPMEELLPAVDAVMDELHAYLDYRPEDESGWRAYRRVEALVNGYRKRELRWGGKKPAAPQGRG